MEAYYNHLVEAVGTWHPAWTYSFLFISAFVENVVPPVPGE